MYNVYTCTCRNFQVHSAYSVPQWMHRKPLVERVKERIEEERGSKEEEMKGVG